MDTNIVELLQNQMNKERQNAQIYSYISVGCANLAYGGFAKYFMKQSRQELEHAQKISDFLISKRLQPAYRTLSGISSLQNNLKVYANVSYDTELSTTSSLEELYRQAYESEEYQVCAFLVDLLVEQIEEENWTYDLVTLLGKTDESGWIILDHQYGEK